ncbi:SMP-30/gluconolactonase/LRE family protein [Novosphingobium sp. TH158]|uniref:SMP-30/gluconolactonase/LRE family protein n=1 Tax=Novosphingobium sp. TH158 TaxID=2067455 RepID=UPI0020B13BA7|nr:SMP-30/gluconolactonase/LRE family protein [Novosphingobium sp. TH158]
MSGRPAENPAAEVAEGYSLSRVTAPSRLSGANGMRTGADGKLYVAQVSGSRVSTVDPDSGEVRALTAIGGGITAPDDLVFDDAGNLYCTEITLNRVSVLEPNGKARVLQGEINTANPITFHQGRLIVGELTLDARIMELDRNGGAPKVLLEHVPMVNAFDVGPDGKLYFPAQGANEIWRIGLDGGEPEVVAKDLGVPDSVKFHPDGYIVSTQVHSGQVLKIDPRTGSSEVLANIGPGLDNVTFVGKRIFVSHITGSIHEITAPGTAKPLIERGLQWPLGLAVAADGTLFIADGGFVYTKGDGEPDLVGHLFSNGFPGWTRGVAASAPGEWIVTTAAGTVAKFRPAAEESEVLAAGLGVPVGVALAADGAVVFTDAQTGKVQSAKGGNVEDLASGLSYPTGVAIGPDGTIYVSETDAGRVVTIAGGKAETLIDGLGQPEGLVISGGKLHVLDVKAKELVQADLSGGGRRVLASSLPVGAPEGMIMPRLGGIGIFCGPMWTFSGLAAAADGTIYIAGNGEGSVLALKAE